MGLGQCCRKITSTTDMSAEQIVDTTLECTRDAYPCELIKAVDHLKHTVDLSTAAQACLLASHIKRQKKLEAAATDRKTVELCRQTISEWDGDNAPAYQCCKGKVSNFILQHSKLPPEDFVTTECDSVIKNSATLHADAAENWITSLL